MINELLLLDKAISSKISCVGPYDFLKKLILRQPFMSDQQRMTDALKREMMILQESRVELEKHIEKLVKEREELNKKIEESKTMKSEEARVGCITSFGFIKQNLRLGFQTSHTQKTVFSATEIS